MAGTTHLCNSFGDTISILGSEENSVNSLLLLDIVETGTYPGGVWLFINNLYQQNRSKTVSVVLHLSTSYSRTHTVSGSA
jgi:hypothetical protein